jgi:hypothetical protein
MFNLARYVAARVQYALKGCDFVRREGANIRICPICGRREELDIDDGASLNAWNLLWKGYPERHFAGLRPQTSRAPLRPKAPGLEPTIQMDEPDRSPGSLAK